MRQFLDLVQTILRDGKRKGDPQGVGNVAILGHTMRFHMADGFPLITTRNLRGSWKAMVHELLWFLSGSSRVEDLHQHGVHLWDQWATPEICTKLGLATGDLGPIYGPQWRRWRKSADALLMEIDQSEKSGVTPSAIIREWRKGMRGYIDQIANVVDEIRRFPNSRRLVVTAWDPEDVDSVFVAPCHFIFKFFVAEGELSLHLIQRSADVIVGVPFNIAEYALLLLMMAQVTGLKAGEFVHTLSDAHIYINQISYAQMQLEREPRSLPRVRLNRDIKGIFDFRFEDFVLEDYNPHPAIKGIPVAL